MSSWLRCVDVLLAIGLFAVGLFEIVILANEGYWNLWRFWWGAMHISLGMHLLIAARWNCGWVIPAVILGILSGELFALRPHTGRWNPGISEILIPLLEGACCGLFTGLVLDAVQSWLDRHQKSAHQTTEIQ